MEGFIEVYPGITMDPAVRFGKPCIKGTRIDVATVLGRFATADSLEAIQEDYPHARSGYGGPCLCNPRSRACSSRC
jgi:uncharacterized protein (DUF433 family)